MSAVGSIKIKAPLYYRPSLQRDKTVQTDGTLVGFYTCASWLSARRLMLD